VTIDERRERARQWLEQIYVDVQDLILDDYMFWEVQQIIRDNPTLTTMRSHFFHWMMAAHVESAAIGIRRQIKLDDQSISLRRFLEELKAYPAIVSRTHHVELCTSMNANLPRSFHEHTFDRHVGAERDDVDPVVIQSEIDRIRAVASRIEHFADRRFAHYDSRGVAAPEPTFNEIGDSLGAFEVIILQYKMLLDGVSTARLLPVFQYDWKGIFRHPWIVDEPAPDG
jgi:hypothetical protein